MSLVFVDCPVCFGDGEHDFTESDIALAPLIVAGMFKPLGVVPCDECEATGIVTEDHAKDIRAASVAFVDQALARFHHAGLLPLPKEETT